jgi:hypothetical protein
LEAQLKGNGKGATAAILTRPILTTGEVFADGSTIELISGSRDGNPALMLWDGSKETIGARVEHHGQLYEPTPINRSILQELILPTHCCSHGSTREFLVEICKLITNLVGLQEKPASLIGRIVLCTSIIDAVSVAPALMIVGPDIARGNQLVALLRCLCRHALPLTGVTPAGFCSLSSGARFTYLISQVTMSDKLWKLLDDASSRDRRIPVRGRLLDLFGVQVIHSDSIPGGDSGRLRSIQISMVPTGQELPVFDSDAKHRIAAEFQAKLLSFRRANLYAASKLQFDASKFTFALRDLARSLATATPDDLELQAEVFDLLREKDDEIRAGKWIELNVVAAESMLVACQESPGGCKYVGEVAAIAQEILRGRGEDIAVDPGAFGKRLKVLGFRTEPRDAKGMRLQMTEDVLRRAQQLAHDLGAPQVMDGGPTEPARTGRKRNPGCGKLGV